MSFNDEELLSAYLDGEVTAEEQARVERRLAEDVGYRQLYEELRAIRQHLEALPPQRLPADFAQSVLAAAERQMVAPSREADEQPAPAGPHERRWVRPLVWSGLIAAAAVLVMIFSPSGQPPRNVARQDPPMQAREEKLTDNKVAAPASRPAEISAREQLRANENRAVVGKNEASRDAEHGWRGDGNADKEVEKQEAISQKLKAAVPAKPVPPATAPPVVAAPALNAAASAAPESNLDSPPPAGAAASSPLSAPGEPTQNQLQKKADFGFAQGTQEGAAAGAQAPAGKGRQYADETRSAFDAGQAGGERAGALAEAAEPPFAGGNPAPARLNLSVQVATEKDGADEFKQLLAQVQAGDMGERQLSGADDGLQDNDQLRAAPRADNRKNDGRSVPLEELAKEAKDVPADLAAAPEQKPRVGAAQQAIEVDLTHDALVELLAQLRSRPGVYRVEALPADLDKDVNHRTKELGNLARRERRAGDYGDKLADRVAQGQGASSAPKAGRSEPSISRSAEGGSKGPAFGGIAPAGQGLSADQQQAAKAPAKSAADAKSLELVEKRKQEGARLAHAAQKSAPRSYRVRIVLQAAPHTPAPAAATQPTVP